MINLAANSIWPCLIVVVITALRLDLFLVEGTTLSAHQCIDRSYPSIPSILSKVFDRLSNELFEIELKLLAGNHNPEFTWVHKVSSSINEIRN